MEHLKQETVSGAQLNMDALYQICPQCFTESKDSKTGEIHRSVDFDKLRLLLGDNIAQGDERYEFTWVGKRAALQEAAKPIRKTLRPCPEESVDWENTKNLYIEGDNLEVLKLLQNSYMGKVKMIYIDPPYNTGNDFVYHDDFHQSKQDYDLFAGDVNEEGERLIRNTGSNGRFHSDWCSMIYSRLMLARTLLTEDGVIFVSIDDNELKNLENICNELFGESNFVANIIWQSTAGSNTGTDIVTVTENILVYTKNRSKFVFDGKLSDDESFSLSDEYVNERGKYALDKLDRRRVAGHYSEALNFPIEMPDGSMRWPGGTSERSPEGWNYLWSKTKVQWGLDNGFIVFKKSGAEWNVYNKRYAKVDNEGKPFERSIPFRNLITSDQSNTAQGTAEQRMLFELRPFDFPKPTTLLYNLLLTSVRRSKECLILDFFSGSATTAHAIMQLNAEDDGKRRFIMVQWPEETEEDSEAYKAGYKNICEIGKERIRRAGKKILEEQKAKQGDLFSSEKRKLDVGFRVFKCADSNMKDVYYAPSEYDQQMLFDLEDNIKDDRNDLDLLFGCMLDWGVTLDLPLRTEKVDGINIHIVNEGDLVACFEKHIPESVIDHIASLLPMRVVLRDSCFNEAKEKMNFFEIFKQRTGWSEEEVRKNVKVI